VSDPDKDARYRELLAQTGARKDTGNEDES
jgi:hypothetical protein